MKYRKLDANLDYSFGQRSQNFVTGVEAVAQAVLTRLKLYQGEWWEDLENGLPLMQRILGFRNTKNAADILIRERISGTTGVLQMISFTSQFNNETRAYTCQAVVSTIYGEISLAEVTL